LSEYLWDFGCGIWRMDNPIGKNVMM
jgi:hypothetical protein